MELVLVGGISGFWWSTTALCGDVWVERGWSRDMVGVVDFFSVAMISSCFVSCNGIGVAGAGEV